MLGGSAALAFAATAAGEPMTIPIGVEWMRINPGEGQCQLSDEHDERAVIEQLREGNAGSNVVIAMFAPCTDIEAYRSGEGHLADASMLLSPSRSEKPKRGRTNDRAMFLKVVGKSLGRKMNAEEYERILKEVEDRMELSKLGVVMSEPVPLGVLDTDDAAIYQGMLLQAGTEENMETVAAVMAITLVGHYTVFYYMYRTYEDWNTISAMLDVVRRIAATMESASAPTEAG